jgi:hypothetical protein
MRQLLPGFVKRGWKAVWSGVIDWLREWTKPDNHGVVGGVVADATRSNSELMLENALLRQQLIVVSRQVERPRMGWRERGIMVLLASKRYCWRTANYAASLAKRDLRVGAGGMAFNQLMMRDRLTAEAIDTFCKCVFANPR